MDIFPKTKKQSEKHGASYSLEVNRNAKFPSRLRELRELDTISQAGLSDILGISKSTLGLWETGHTLPDAKSLNDLADYFHVSADYILCRTDSISKDVEIRQTCDYTGLDESTVELFHKSKQFPHWNELISHILRIVEIMGDTEC